MASKRHKMSLEQRERRRRRKDRKVRRERAVQMRALAAELEKEARHAAT
jgi:hypothetical protein